MRDYFATTTFEMDIYALRRYGIKKAMLPVLKVKALIDKKNAMEDRLISLCPISENDPVTVNKGYGKEGGYVTNILIRPNDGGWDIWTDAHNHPIAFENFTKTDGGWIAEVK